MGRHNSLEEASTGDDGMNSEELDQAVLCHLGTILRDEATEDEDERDQPCEVPQPSVFPQRRKVAL